MDKIEITDLECYCHHGVLPEEQQLGQKFLVSLILYMDTRKAGKTDDLSYSVDYAEVAHFVSEKMNGATYQLLESVAEKLAEEILYCYHKVKQVEVCIKKPWAPILLPLKTVSITIQRKWTRVYVGVGSNIGNRRKYIDDAFAGIRNDRFCKSVYMSSLIDTEPYGYENQENFLNGVICFDTMYSPDELLEFLHRLEDAGQRTREIHWGPRTIDLDILFYGNEIIQKKELMIPHKEIPLRRFVLEPLNEIAPFLLHPVLNQTVAELYEAWKQSNHSGTDV